VYELGRILGEHRLRVSGKSALRRIFGGGDSLIKRIYGLIMKIWMQEKLPDEWKGE